jgi:hypothetical protein
VGSAYVNAGAAIRPRGQAMMIPTRAVDMACLAGVLIWAGFVAWAAAYPFLGHITDQNAFYSADTGRVYAYLTGNTEGYYRMKVHPLYGWLCIFYQSVVINWLKVPPWIGIPVLSGTIAVTCAGLLYAAMRRLGVVPLTAASFVFLFTSSATYVFWSSLAETHMLAGATVVAAVLVMTWPGTQRTGVWKSAAALAIGCSIVVTDGMIWILRQIDFSLLRQGGFRTFLRGNLARVRPLLKPAALGVGLIYLLWSPEWPILGKRVGIPFNFLEERNFVELQPHNSILSIHIFGLTPPGIPFGWLVPLLSVGAMIAALFVLRSRLWFIPLFALFGVMLHLVYSGDSAFLFSPDYMPMFILTLALLAKEKLPNWIPGIVIPLALALFVLNLHEWNNQIQALDAAGGLKTFDTVTLH